MSLRFAFFVALLSFPVLVSAQDDAAGAPEEPSIHTDAFYVLQQQYRKEKASVFAPYAEKLKVFLEAKLAAAEKLYVEKKRKGNIKGMAMSTKAKAIYTKALEELKEKNDFTMPSNVRKELKPDIDACVAEKEKAFAAAKKQAEDLKAKYKASFAELYKALYAEGEPPAEEIDRRYKEFLSADIPPPAKPKEEENNAASAEELRELGVDSAPKEPEEQLDPIIASKGQGSKWADVGKWIGDMMGMDVVELPLAGKKEPFSWTQFSGLANADSKLKYEPIRELPPNPDFAFRLKRIPGRRGVEVMEWPSETNSWTLSFRTERATASEQEYPLKRGFILQVSLPGNGLETAFGKGCVAAPATGGGKGAGTRIAKIPIKIFTRPQKAAVFINGKLYTLKGKPVLTPCQVPMPSSGCEVKLHILGFLPKIFSNYKPVKGGFIKAALQKDPSFKAYQKKIAASAKTWIDSKVKLNVGDRVILKISGIWCCASAKDKCGPEGIPNDLKHYKYYADATNDHRQESNYPYGALLMKIGENGQVRHVSRRSLQFMVRTPGELYFDINEREGKPRKNNKGQLIVNILVKTAAGK